MPKGLDVMRMREAVRATRVEWQRHALERMAERGIRRANALRVLLSGHMIEDYSADQPLVSPLFLGWSGPPPLHVVVAFDLETERAFVITAYEPALHYFEPGFRVGRRP